VFESLGEGTAVLGGRTVPCPGIIEDDDGIRMLVMGDRIRVSTWMRAHASGISVVIEPDADYENIGHWVTTETFMEERESIAGEFIFPMHMAQEVRGEISYTLMMESPNPVAEMMASSFVHLHAHSEHSAIDGLSTVEEMVEQACADNQEALGLTDHGVCAGHVELQKVCDERGLKPVFGVEANFVDNRKLREGLFDYHHLVLWAMNEGGLRNLWAITTEGNRDGFYGRPRVDWETLDRYHEGVMASTACVRGPVGRLLLDEQDDRARQVLGRLLGIFGDRLYAEISTADMQEQRLINDRLIALAEEFSIPLVATVDSHYPCPDDREVHRVWIAAQTNKDLVNEADLFQGEGNFYVMSHDDVLAALPDLSPMVVGEAISNTVEVARRCNARIIGKSTPPVFSKQGGVKRDNERLVQMCLNNWADKVPADQQQIYMDRFEQEMGLLIRKNLCGYFLIIADETNWARAQGALVGPGRGSGGGSLVANLAGITAIDPVEAKLMFERFLTEGRTELPDFDVDYPQSFIERLYEHDVEMYGQENVVRVGTHIRHKNKGVIRRLATVLSKSEYDIHWPDIDAISEIIEAAEAHTAGKGLKWQELWDLHEEELEPYRVKYPYLFELAERMVGRLVSYGQHAAGVVISIGESLEGRVPMRTPDQGKSGKLVTEWDMVALAALGLIKNDHLVLRTLDTLQMCIDLAKEQLGITIHPDSWHRDVEYADPLVWEAISDGNTLGCFQIESVANTRLCKQLKPTNIQELADLITLVRPGPMRSGLTFSYLRRRDGKEEIEYPDPRLKDSLAATYGTMIYQEQVMEACQTLAGYTLEEADDVRSVLGKKYVEKIEAVGQKFIPAAIEYGGLAEENAQRIFDQMREFSKYSFNKAHAWGYALIAYWCAWLKINTPLQFLVAVLSTVDKKRIPAFVAEARRMGYTVSPPDINESGRGFSATATTVRYGLDSVKGVGDAAVTAILAAQPYSDWDDFLARKTGCNMGVVRSLASIGTFDSLVPNRASLEAWLFRDQEGLLDRCALRDDGVVGAPNDLPCTYDWSNEPVELGRSGRPKKPKPPPKKCTKACRQYVAPDRQEMPGAEEYSDAEIRQREFDLLGLYLSSTPFDGVRERLGQSEFERFCRGDEIESGPEGQYITVGLVSRIKKHMDKSGGEMAFLAVTTQNADLDVTVFKKKWATLRSQIHPGAMVFAAVNKNDRGLSLVDCEVLPVHEVEAL
jgi:DNA polymerase-3 subunit alpha